MYVSNTSSAWRFFSNEVGKRSWIFIASPRRLIASLCTRCSIVAASTASSFRPKPRPPRRFSKRSWMYAGTCSFSTPALDVELRWPPSVSRPLMTHPWRCTNSRCKAYRTVEWPKYPCSFFGNAAKMGLRTVSSCLTRLLAAPSPKAPSTSANKLLCTSSSLTRSSRKEGLALRNAFASTTLKKLLRIKTVKHDKMLTEEQDMME
mmetsp:Transcript_44465/g.77399  ORF Transcript_44465/g.77399 Transcript_44465/m.77399 type:complete len:205 (-) Transcript_44465:84-698(-)